MVNQFKQVAVDQHVDDVKDIYVPTFFLDIREALSTLLRAKKAQLVYGEICQVSIRSYPGLIWQILSNLARNAVVHGFPEERPGWELRFDAIEIGDKVELRIADNGIGIPIALRPRIFEPFFTTRRSDGSTGLGLHIVYNLVSQKLGGTIRLAADPPPGCVFTIRLPKEVPDSSLESGEVPSS